MTKLLFLDLITRKSWNYYNKQLLQFYCLIEYCYIMFPCALCLELLMTWCYSKSTISYHVNPSFWNVLTAYHAWVCVIKKELSVHHAITCLLIIIIVFSSPTVYGKKMRSLFLDLSKLIRKSTAFSCIIVSY